MPLTTSSAHLEKTVTCVASVQNAPPAEARTLRREPSSPSRVSWPSYSTISGVQGRSTSPSTSKHTKPAGAEKSPDFPRSREKAHRRKKKTNPVISTDPKKLRVHRPVRATATPPWVRVPPKSWASTETGTEIAAPQLVGPQHAPSSSKAGSTKCEWKPGETTPPSDRSYLRHRLSSMPLIQARSP